MSKIQTSYLYSYIIFFLTICCSFLSKVDRCQWSSTKYELNQYFANNVGSMILQVCFLLIEIITVIVFPTEMSILLQSLDGFLVVLNEDGKFLYVSNLVTVYLGFAQVSFFQDLIFNFFKPVHGLNKIL